MPYFKVATSLGQQGIKLSKSGQLRILAIGSSSTEGAGSSARDRAYPPRLEALLERAGQLDDVEVVNAGVGGETADQTLDRLEALVSASRFDIVIWQVGTNDAVRGGDEARFSALLERGISTVKDKAGALILLDQQFFPGIKDLPRYERFVSLVSAAAERAGVTLFSRYTLMKTWAERSGENILAMLAKDGFHMSDLGYQCLATHLSQQLQPVIARSIMASASSVAQTSPNGPAIQSVSAVTGTGTQR